MKTFSFSILLLFISQLLLAQKVKEEEIFTAVEKQAEYPGGMGAFSKFLQKNLKYKKAGQKNIYGRTYIEFVVEKDGHITNFTISPYGVIDNLDTTFLVKLKKIKWIPAMFKGKRVRSRFTMPINIYVAE